MVRSVSRSPSPVRHRHIRRSRRQRSRSPYTRRRSRSSSPRHRRSRSPTRRRKGRSPTPQRHRRRKSRSSSPLASKKSPSPRVAPTERKNTVKKQKNDEEEEKKRIQHEIQMKLLEEETATRIEEAIRKNVVEKLNSEDTKLEIKRRIEDAQKKLFDDVTAQLKNEKETALTEARRKEEQARREREELDKMLEENQRRVQESQRREALELKRELDERQRELGLLQRQKEDSSRRKKQDEEEERANQILSAEKPSNKATRSWALSQHNVIQQTPTGNGENKMHDALSAETLNGNGTPGTICPRNVIPKKRRSERAIPRSGKKLAFKIDTQRLSKEYMSQRRVVTDEEKEAALKRATEALTEGSFLVVMRPTSVYTNFYLSIPGDWINKNLPSRHHHQVILRIGEKTWMGMFHNNRRRGHSDGFATGWKNFTIENNLEDSDVCVFTPASQKGDAGLILDVKIFRVVPEITPLTPLLCSIV